MSEGDLKPFLWPNEFTDSRSITNEMYFYCTMSFLWDTIVFAPRWESWFPCVSNVKITGAPCENKLFLHSTFSYHREDKEMCTVFDYHVGKRIAWTSRTNKKYCCTVWYIVSVFDELGENACKVICESRIIHRSWPVLQASADRSRDDDKEIHDFQAAWLISLRNHLSTLVETDFGEIVDSPQLLFPDEFSNPLVHVVNSIHIEATPEIIWRVLTDVLNWNTWFPFANSRVLSPYAPEDSHVWLLAGVLFSINVDEYPMTCKVLEYEYCRNLTWIATGVTLEAMHKWSITPLLTSDGRQYCRIVSDCRLIGILASLLISLGWSKESVHAAVTKRHSLWLMCLKFKVAVSNASIRESINLSLHSYVESDIRLASSVSNVFESYEKEKQQLAKTPLGLNNHRIIETTWSPKFTLNDLYIRNEIVILAEPSIIWFFLTNCQEWSSWCRGIVSTKIADIKVEYYPFLLPDSTFDLILCPERKDAEQHLHSTVVNFQRDSLLSFISTSSGMLTKVLTQHSWQIIAHRRPADEQNSVHSCTVILERKSNEWFMFSDAAGANESMAFIFDSVWLSSLKRQAESFQCGKPPGKLDYTCPQFATRAPPHSKTTADLLRPTSEW
jgi:hypothetical protein